MRYLSQTVKNSCGPLAIVNAARHLGKKVSKKYYQKLARKYDLTNGISFICFVDLLNEVKKEFDLPQFQYVSKLNLRKVDQILKQGHSLIFSDSYWHEHKLNYHMSLLVGRSETGDAFKLVNYYGKNIVEINRFRFWTGYYQLRYGWIVPRLIMET